MVGKMISATVAKTRESVLVYQPNDDDFFRDNPWGFPTDMWYFTNDDRIYHKDELIFD